MRIPRIFSHTPLAGVQELELDEAASRHLVKVLRLEAGRELVLFDGAGGEYHAQMLAPGKRARVRLGEHRQEERESPLHLILAIGISRGERFDWVVQKATELGVSEIQPLFSERCEVKLPAERREKKLAHWQQVAISACEQCARNRVPRIAPPVNIAEYLARAAAELKLVLHHRTQTDLRSLVRERDNPASVALLVGPEGGLSPAEIDTAERYDFVPLRLGPRVLRTETAPVAAISVLQSHWGDL